MPINYFVEYIDEFGVEQSEIWSESVLNDELFDESITITHIELSYRLKEELGIY